jgi:tRNA threonylcarbamoyladenosine biosynthesis protein TsaB
MLTLGVDTAEPIGGVALFEDGVLAEERLMSTPLKHAESLIPSIERLLQESSRSRDEIERVSVNRGPGSFTGLRIGLATAEGLCQAIDAGLVGVDGAYAYRSRVPDARRVCVVLHSRRDLFYATWFAGPKMKGPTQLLREGELIGRLNEEERELTLVGGGAERIFGRISDHPTLRLAPEKALRPSPLAIARIGAREETAGRLYGLEPLYVEAVLT